MKPVCCHELPLVRKAVSPFSKVIVLDWLDMSTGGILECEVCQTAYRFEMLDKNPDWDTGKELRIYSLYPLVDGDFAEMVEIGSQIWGMPKWPFWGYPWTSQSAEEEQKVYDKIYSILYNGRIPEFVIAAVDITKEILVSKEVDWFSFLELSRKEREYDEDE